jgi:hypothetical protein
MRVYAESNFVLELVLEHEQHQACEELVSLAAVDSLELVLPAFALLEPYQTIVRRRIEGKVSTMFWSRAHSNWSARHGSLVMSLGFATPPTCC